MNIGRKQLKWLKKQNGLRCNDEHCQGYLHVGMYLPIDGSVGYMCSLCDSVYLCDVVCVEKNHPCNVGVYLITTRIASNNRFEDWCDKCAHNPEATMQAISVDEPPFERRLMEIGSVRLISEQGEHCRFLSVDHRQFVWRVLYKQRCLLRYTMRAENGAIFLE